MISVCINLIIFVEKKFCFFNGIGVLLPFVFHYIVRVRACFITKPQLQIYSVKTFSYWIVGLHVNELSFAKASILFVILIYKFVI